MNENIIHDALLDLPKQELVKQIRTYQSCGFGIDPKCHGVVWNNKDGSERIAFYTDGGYTFLESKVVKDYREQVECQLDKIKSLEKENKQLSKSLTECERDLTCYKSEKENAVSPIEFPNDISIAEKIVSDLEKMYIANKIYALDNGMELFDNDLRKIAQHLLVEIGDI